MVLHRLNWGIYHTNWEDEERAEPMPLLVTKKQEQQTPDLRQWLASPDVTENRLADHVLTGMGLTHGILYLTELAGEEELKRQALLDQRSWMRRPLRATLLLTIGIVPFVHNLPIVVGLVLIALGIGISLLMESLPLHPKPVHRAALLKLTHIAEDTTALPVLVEALRNSPTAMRERVAIALIRLLPKMSPEDFLTTEQWGLLLKQFSRVPRDLHELQYHEQLALAIIAAIRAAAYFGAMETLTELTKSPPQHLQQDRVRQAATECLTHLHARQREMSRNQGAARAAARQASLRTYRAMLGLSQLPVPTVD